MPSLLFFRYRFTPPWWACLLTAASVGLFSLLGAWQLQRANEKRLILANLAHAATLPPRTWQAGDALPAPFERIEVSGHFLSEVFLLDNQANQHQMGFHVLSPFVQDTSRSATAAQLPLILIDRGWIRALPTRLQLPAIETPEHTLTLAGSAYYPAANHWTIGPTYEVRAPRLTIIEHVDCALISDFLHKSVNPFIMRLSEEMPYGYKRTWAAVSMPPERHLGYALQWFTFALTSVVLLVVLNTKHTKA